MNRLFAPSRRSIREESGQAIVMITLALVGMLGLAALAIDVGYAYYVQRSLQSSADAAALAGASQLPNGGTAVSVARAYSGSAGNKNERANVPGVTTTVTAKCVSIAPCFPVNAVDVKETAVVPTRFAKVLGFDSFEVNARATACSPCATRPLDVMLVLDRTLSMCMDHWGNYNSSCPDLNNARNGLKTFLGFMDPALDRVGLAVFPPATSMANRCSTPASISVTRPPPPGPSEVYSDPNYHNSGYAYTVAQLETNYKNGTTLNTSSTLVSTINCVKGGGTTAYALAIEKAQTELNTRGRPTVQDVIVFFSDGGANYGPKYSPYGSTSPYRTQPCHQGVDSAAAVKSTGTLIYSIGYDLTAAHDEDDVNVCKSYTGFTESPFISATSTLQQIASSPDEFFNQPTAGELNTIYTKIAGEINGAKLIDGSVS